MLPHFLTATVLKTEGIGSVGGYREDRLPEHVEQAFRLSEEELEQSSSSDSSRRTFQCCRADGGMSPTGKSIPLTQFSTFDWTRAAETCAEQFDRSPLADIPHRRSAKDVPEVPPVKEKTSGNFKTFSINTVIIHQSIER